MKKIYLLLIACFAFSTNILKAQCPVTITPSPAYICPGGTATLTAMGATTYTWNTGSASDLLVTSPATTTVYTVTGTTGTCTSSAVVTVYVNANPTITVNSSPSAICTGSTATLTAIGAMTYTWAPAVFLTPTTGSPVYATPSSGMTYTVGGTDANGCTSYTTTQVSVNPPLTLSIVPTNPTCSGACDGSASVYIISGPPGATYLWDNFVTTALYSNICAGTHSVIVTDVNGCTATASTTISSPPPITVSVTSTNVSCNNSCDGSATVTVTGGSAPYVYDWGTGTPYIQNLCAGTYSLDVMDANACTGTASATILSPPILIAIVTSSNASCGITCDGSATVTASGGTPPYNYAWDTGDMNQAITSLCTATSYAVFVFDSNGCTDSASTTISAPASPTVGFVMQKDTVNPGVWYAYPAYSADVINATWYWGDGISTSGLSPSHTYTTAAHYNICVSVFSACGDSAQSCQNDSIYRTSNANSMITVDVVNATTGIKQTSASSNQLSVYPNPANQSITVSGNQLTNNSQIQITDMLGNIVKQVKGFNSECTIDISVLNEGIYNVSIISNKGIINKKLIISR